MDVKPISVDVFGLDLGPAFKPISVKFPIPIQTKDMLFDL
jgi:hypothetical protein